MIASMSTASGLAVRGRIRPTSLSPKRHHGRVTPPRAVPVPLETLLALAEVGDVEAPSGAIFVAAAIATVAVLLVPFGLKGGTDAANEMQARDSKSGRWRK